MTDARERLWNHDAEAALNGCLLVDPAAVHLVGPLVGADEFHSARERWTFDAILEAHRDGGVSVMTVLDALERAGRLEAVGGTARLAALVNAMPSALQAEAYAAIVRDRATRRRLLAAASEVARAAHDLGADVEDALASAEGAVLAVRRDGASGGRVAGADLARALYARYEEWVSHPVRPGEPRWPSCGIGPLDDALGGLKSGLYIVAGRPSMGKTALLLQMAAAIAGRGEPTLAFSVEQSAEQVGERLATGLADVELKRLTQGRTTPEENGRYAEALGIIASWPLAVVDKATLRPSDVLAEARRFRQERGALSAVFVDGLWLMTPQKERENRTQTVGSISRDLKRVQRELDVPLVVAHQLSRGCEQRGDKRPLLSDLRDAGDVEQDADVVLMLYREGYYSGPEHPRRDVAEVWIRKNRLAGPAGVQVELYWQAKYMRFEKLSRDRGDPLDDERGVPF